MKQFEELFSGGELPHHMARKLIESGFLVIPGTVQGDRLAGLTATYDELMASASGPDFNIASTTTRMADLLNHSPAFDDIFLHPLVLQACKQSIGEPFKLSSFLARTLRPKTPAQKLHVDLPRGSKDAPLVGFIFMVDPFRKENGATRFVPGSQRWPDQPSDRLVDTCEEYPGEVNACGKAGSMIVFNGAIWHGHTANVTSGARRSIQGYFVRRNARSGTDFSEHLLPATQARMSPLAKYLLALRGVRPEDQ